ncbi:MAG TPA: acyltransferase [Puia sp.]|nr:acyltransferase [Puia sp.]
MTTFAQGRTPWIDHLRAFITVLVIAHHAALAYATFAAFHKEAYILSTHPVVDPHRWVPLDLFISFNDSFFMPLMFFISGLFTLPALQRKGAARFIRDRFRRLFIPFLLGVIILMEIAYYPAWLLSGHSIDIAAYLRDFFTVEAWPVGPPWFIWVLFLFDVIVAMLYRPLMSLSAWITRMRIRPGAFILFFLLSTQLLYVPAALLFGSNTWTGIGPFDFQESRLLLYFGYFLTGAVIGVTRLDQQLFRTDNRLSKSWLWWMTAGVAAFIVQAFIFPGDGLPHSMFFALTTSLTCIAFLGVFKVLSNTESHIGRSLSGAAYGMYLVHYIFVVWMQYALVHIDLPAGVKFMIVFITATLASWLLIKKIPARAGTHT